MVILRDNTGVVVKQTIQSENHVRVGIFQTILWVGGIARSVRYNQMPHNELTINDCANLLKELEYLERVTS